MSLSELSGSVGALGIRKRVERAASSALLGVAAFPEGGRLGTALDEGAA